MSFCNGGSSPCGDGCMKPGYSFVPCQQVNRFYDYESAFLCGTVFLLRAGEIKIPGTKDGTMLKVTRGLAAAFLVLAILFYTILWTYVKGAVAVVAPV